jgi:2-polyprenyl-3-methyl-5-hydroxy-6-metoxy-1,4-benzoquinol methylase
MRLQFWNHIHEKKEWGRYPPEELVRFIYNTFAPEPNRSRIRILDVGCASGACSWFLAREGFSVTGIDASEIAIGRARGRFDEDRLRGKFIVVDFTKPLQFSNESFDAVIDIEALYFVSSEEAKKTITGDLPDTETRWFFLLHGIQP